MRKASGQLVDPDGPSYKSRGAGAGSHSLGSAHPEAPSSSADRRRRGTRERSDSPLHGPSSSFHVGSELSLILFCVCVCALRGCVTLSFAVT